MKRCILLVVLCEYIRDARTYECYRGADKSLARPGRKQGNISVRMAWISFGALPWRKKKLDESLRLDVVEMKKVYVRYTGVLISP